MDPDPAIFVLDLQEANKKLFFNKFFCLLLFEGTFTSFSQDKKSQRIRIRIPNIGVKCGELSYTEVGDGIK
jgi:hypothetical protein